MAWTLPQALGALGRFVFMREGPAGENTSLDKDEFIIELIGEPSRSEGQG
jgi:hypothetical protein